MKRALVCIGVLFKVPLALIAVFSLCCWLMNVHLSDDARAMVAGMSTLLGVIAAVGSVTLEGEP